MRFKNRTEAGQKLIPKLEDYKGNPDAVIIALPRGGVVLGYELAKGLNLPLDLVVPRKIGAPENEEFAIGAIAEDGEAFLDSRIINSYGIQDSYIQGAIEKEKKEAARRLKVYREDLPPRDLKDKICIIVDDGIATGRTLRAAIATVKKEGAKRIVVAVPVSARDSLEKIQEEVNEVVCLHAPLFFGAVGKFYSEFPQNTDQEIIKLMKRSHSEFQSQT